MRTLLATVSMVLAGLATAPVQGQGKPVDINGTITFGCAFGGACPDGDALVSDAAGPYAQDSSQDTFVFLAKDGRLQFRLSNESGTRSLFMNLVGGVPLCTAGALHCYWTDYPGVPGWVSTFGRDGGSATVVNGSGSDVKNGLNSLAVGSWAYGRFVVNWDDPDGRDMRWGLTFRGADQQLRSRRVTGCTWEIVAGVDESGQPDSAMAVLSAWPKIKRAYTEIPQATFEIPFSLTFSTCP